MGLNDNDSRAVLGEVSTIDPVMHGRQVYLRPIFSDDYRTLRGLELSEHLGYRWRFRGATPTPEQWAQDGTTALLQLLVVRTRDHLPLGVTAVYGHNFQDGHANLGVAAFNTDRSSALFMLGTALFIQYTFDCWAFRKLYLEVPEFNMAPLSSSVGKLFVEEGRMPEHLYYGGRYWSKIVLAIYRKDWDARAEKVLAAARPGRQKVAVVTVPPRHVPVA